MSEKEKTGDFCKGFCWLIGIIAGAYLAYVLVFDFAQEGLRSGVLGIVAMLLVGLLLRRLICRSRGDKVNQRKREAKNAGKQVLTREAQLAEHAAARMAVAKGETAVAGAQVLDTAVAQDDAAIGRHLEDAAHLDDVPEALAEEDNEELSETAELPEEEYEEPAEGAEKPQDLEQRLLDLKQGLEERAPPVDVIAEPSGEDESIIAVETVVTAEAGETRDLEAPAPPVPADSAVETPKVVAVRPEALDGPRDDFADDLTQIKDITPEIQANLNACGIYHFDQLGSMTSENLAWLDHEMPGADGGATPKRRWRRLANRILVKNSELAVGLDD